MGRRALICHTVADLTLETHLMQRYPQSAEIRSEAVKQFLFKEA